MMEPTPEELRRALAAARTLRAHVAKALELAELPEVSRFAVKSAERVATSSRVLVAELDAQIGAIAAWLAGYEHARNYQPTCTAVLGHGGGVACELQEGHAGQHASGDMHWRGADYTECPEDCSNAHKSAAELD